MYKYTTGVVYSVSIWLTIRPPTIVMPSGRRSSEPVPVPSASGKAPSKAAAVVSEQARSTAWWADAQRTRLITWEYLKYVAVLTRQTLAPKLAEDAPTVVARGRG